MIKRIKVKGAAKRLWDTVAPLRPARPERGYRRVLRWAALPVTDRRWAAPLCAAALGFGLFAGVAIGPGASAGSATGAQYIALGGPAEEEAGAEGTAGEEDLESGEGGGEAESFPEAEASEEFFGEEEFFEEPEVEEEPFEPEELPEEEASAEPEEEEEEATTLSGVVVHANPAAGSYTIAETGGVLTAIHAAKLPKPGAKVSTPARALANGTNAEAGTRKQTGTKKGVTFAGVVTFVDPDPAAPSYTVSKRGASVLVRVHPDPSGTAPPLPALGVYASVTADVELAPPPAPAPPPAGVAPPAPSCAPDPASPPPTPPAATAVLWQRSVDADGAPFASSDIAGVVMAVCPSQNQVLISADDLREAGRDVVLTAPGSIDLGGLKPGESVAAMVEIEAGGALKLTGLASDERTKGADDAEATQGELVPQVAE